VGGMAHNRIVASVPPEASLLAVLSTATLQASPAWTLRVTCSLPVAESQTLTFASGPQTASVLESAANATDRTGPAGDALENVSFRVARSHTFTSPSPYPSPGLPGLSRPTPVPAANDLPLGANAKDQIYPACPRTT